MQEPEVADYSDYQFSLQHRYHSQQRLRHYNYYLKTNELLVNITTSYYNLFWLYTFLLDAPVPMLIITFNRLRA